MEAIVDKESGPRLVQINLHHCKDAAAKIQLTLSTLSIYQWVYGLIRKNYAGFASTNEDVLDLSKEMGSTYMRHHP